MRYALRTTLEFASGDPSDDIGRADTILQWLYEELPTKATLGTDVAAPQWSGNRYREDRVIFELFTQYQNVYAATADRQRIASAVAGMPNLLPDEGGIVPSFQVMRVYGERELLNLEDPTKKTTHPC
jgi:hypothetical protein